MWKIAIYCQHEDVKD